MSHTSDLARPRRGFNTLELVATLVLVGVLSALGAFGYARFIDDAGHQVDVAEVTAIARKATALGAFNGLETQTETTPDSGEWSDAFDGSDFTVVTGEAVEDNEVVVSDPWTETDGASWSAAAAKVDGECVFAVADSSGNVDVAQAPDGVPCNPAYAAPPSGDGDVGFISEPSAPELPTLTDPEGAFEFDEGNDPSEGAFDVAITWPPADDNGAPVESYTILLSTEPDMSDPVEIVTGTNQTAFVLDDLDRTEDYYVTVAATNRADTGEESDPLAFTTPASPPSPVQNLVGDSGVFASELSWDAPVDDGDSTDGDPADDIAGYTVSVSTDGGQTYTEIADLGSTTTTYTHSDLDGGETYDYQVVAYNDDSDNEEGYPEETTVVAGDAEAPDAPDAPAAAVSGDGILTASWTEPVLNGAPIDEYEVEIDPACTSTFGGSHNGITSTSAHFTGLAGGVGHAFRVRARNAAGWSPFSEVSACTTAHVVPDAPGEDTVVRSDATATITFTAPAFDGGSTITGYVIEVNDGNGWATAADTDGDAADLAATVVLVDDTAPYDVRISATNSVGTGSHIEFTAAIAVLVDAPTVTAVSAGAADVQLSWSTPDAHGETITGYDLEYRFHIDGVGWTNFTTLTSVGATVNAHTHDEFTGGHELVPGVSYEHRVRAAAQSPGNWGTAAPVVPFVALGAPDAPALAIVSASSLDASWTAPDVTGTGQQIGGYELELLDTSLAVVDSASTGASTLTHSFTGLTQGAVYYAKIRAISDVDANPTAWSSLSAGTATATIPNYVQNVAFTAGDSEVTATWDAAVDNGSAITGYDVRLYSCANNGLVSAHDGQPASPTSLTAAATPGTALYARVWATNGIGQSSGATPSACATPYAAPDTPSWVSATAPSAAGSYVLDWAQPANNGDTIDQYHLQMYSCPSGQTFQGQEFIAGESAHQFTWTGATHGMNRKFRVRAQNAAGWGAYSAWSACLGATTMAAPDYVQNVVITGGSSEVTVTWDAAVDNGSAITSYDVRIYFCSTGAAASIKDGQPASPTSFTQVATPGDEVYARVWANNAVGSSSGAYLSACTTIYTTPGTPVPAVSTGDASATVTWPTPAGNGSAVTGYGYRWTCGNGWQPFTSPAYPAGWSYAHLTNSASITGTNANGQSVANGVSCTYQVRAFNAAGASAWGAATATASGVPDAPVWVSASAGVDDGVFHLDWTDPDMNGSALTYYRIGRYNCNYTWNTHHDQASSSIGWANNPVGVAYRFQIWAHNANGASAGSGFTDCLTIRNSPVMHSITAASGDPIAAGELSGSITYSLNGGTLSHIVYHVYNCNNTVGGVLADIVTSASSFTWTGGTPGSSYRFAAIVTTDVGNTGWLWSGCATTIGAPAAPAWVSVTGDGTTAWSLDWDLPANNGDVITSYYVQAWTCGGSGAGATTINGANSHATSWTSGAGAGVARKFRVRATNGLGGNSGWSAYSACVTLTGPPTMTSVTGSASGNVFSGSIAYDANGGALSHIVYHVYVCNGGYVTQGISGSTSYSFTLNHGTSYTVAAIVVTNAGNTGWLWLHGGSPGQGSCVTTSPAWTDTNISISKSGNDYVVDWQDVPGATYYAIHRWREGVGWTTISNDIGSASTFTEAGVAGYYQQYRVFAGNAAGSTSWVYSSGFLADWDQPANHNQISRYACYWAPTGNAESQTAPAICSGNLGNWPKISYGDADMNWGWAADYITNRYYGTWTVPRYGCWAFHATGDDWPRLDVGSSAWGTANPIVVGSALVGYRVLNGPGDATACAWLTPGTTIPMIVSNIELTGTQTLQLYFNMQGVVNPYAGWNLASEGSALMNHMARW